VLLHACGIPTGICYQHITLGDVPETGFCIHALNAVYIKSLDRWIHLDARELMQVLEENMDALYMYLNCLPDNIFQYKKASIEDTRSSEE
jgi:hypothetical protein